MFLALVVIHLGPTASGVGRGERDETAGRHESGKGSGKTILFSEALPTNMGVGVGGGRGWDTEWDAHDRERRMLASKLMYIPRLVKT